MTAASSPAKSPVCFVIMPIADMPGYDTSHFSRVYEFVHKPAIVAAGMTPVRADEVKKTNYIVIDILRKLLDTDMVLCDVSGRNPNVLFELGMAQAFNRPVTIVKDGVTDRIFDIQGLRYTEYDHSLRIDAVRKAVAEISSSLKETLSPGEYDVNSLIQLLSLKPATLPKGKTLSDDTSLLLQAINDLSGKVLKLEQKASSQPPVLKRITVERPGGAIQLELGNIAYVDSQNLGEITGLTSEGMSLQTRDGMGKYIAFSSKEFEGVQVFPF